METNTTKSSAKEYLDYVKYIAKFKIKNYVLPHFKKDEQGNYDRYKGVKKFINMQTPSHGNLGDHAIVYAQKKFFQENFSEYEYLEIPFEDVIRDASKIKAVLGSEDIIGLPGGGNMGDLYLSEEYVRRFVIDYFRGVKIISFPQTFSFTNTSIGNRELEKTIKSYKRNNNLLIVARETLSYDLMQKHYGEDKVILTPDIVLSLDETNEKKREGILTCFRNDKEKVLNGDLVNELVGKLKNEFGKVTVSDTIVPRKVSMFKRDQELMDIWDQFRSSELVITDRLHGMIFAVITNTPCIVFKNSNHKIECTYKDWLQSFKSIKYIQLDEIKNKDEILNLAHSLISSSEKEKGSLNHFIEKYDLIKNFITGVGNERL